jgi:dienelactone hydrolase
MKKETPVHIKAGPITLEGILTIPEDAKGVVLFVHGSGSSHLSPRNNFVAKVLQKASLATLLMDLLTEEEDMVYENRFNIELLTKRLIDVTKWLLDRPDIQGLNIGYFGASTGAAVALEGSIAMEDNIKAIVSRGGRPDLAYPYLNMVNVPTLLIVGELDDVVLGLNEKAYEKLSAEKHLVIISGATHLFEEKGALEQVAEVAKKWFVKYLS